MKKTNLLRTIPKLLVALLICCSFVLTRSPAPVNAAASYYLKATGDWRTSATWSATDGGAALGSGYPVAGDSVYITANGNGLTLTLSNDEACVIFTCSGASTATLAGTQTLTVAGNVTLLATMTIPNTITFTVTGTGNFAGSTLTTLGTINLNGTAHTTTGDFTCVNLTRTGTATITDTLTLTAGEVITVSGTFTATGNSTTNRLAILTTVAGTHAHINTAAQAVTQCKIKDITADGTSWDFNATADNMHTSGCTNIIFRMYWIGGAGSYATTTEWATLSGGTTNPTAAPDTWSRVYFDANSFTATGQIVTLTKPTRYCYSMDWTGSLYSPKLVGQGVSGPDQTSFRVYGDYVTLIPAMVAQTSNSQGFQATFYTASINKTASLPVAMTSTWTFALAGCTLNLASDYGTLGGANSASSSNNSLTITAGTFNTNNFDIYGYLNVTGANLRVVNLGTSDIYGLNALDITNLTYNGANAIIHAGWIYGNAGLTIPYIILDMPSAYLSTNLVCNTLVITGTSDLVSETIITTATANITCDLLSIVGYSTTYRPMIMSNVFGTAINPITATNTVISEASFMDINLANPYNATANIVSNPGFEAGDPPTGWTLAGLGATWVSSGAQTHGGSASGLLTRNGADATAANTIAAHIGYRRVPVTASMWVYATEAGRARIYISDGVGTTVSTAHSGVAGWEQLTVSRTIDATATSLVVGCQVYDGDTSAYFDDATVYNMGAVGDAGGNTNLIGSPAVTQNFINPAGGSLKDLANWSSRLPLPQDPQTFNTVFNSGVTFDITSKYYGAGMDFSGTTWSGVAPKLNLVSSSLKIKYFFGSLTFKYGLSFLITPSIYDEGIYMSGRFPSTLTTDGVLMPYTAIHCKSGVGSVTLLDNFTNVPLSSISFGLSLISGTLTATGDVTAYTFNAGTAPLAGTVLNMGNGTWRVLRVGGISTFTASVAMTLNSDLSTLIMQVNSSDGGYFDGFGKHYHTVIIEGIGNNTSYTIASSNSFDTLKIDASVSAKKIQFTTGTTQTVGDFQRDAGGTKVITLKDSAAANWNITKTDNTPINLGYMNITYSTALPVNTWYAGTTSTNTGFNNNWTFDGSPLTVTTNAATGVTMNKDGVTGGLFNGDITDLAGTPYFGIQVEYGLTPAYGSITAAVNKYDYLALTQAIPVNLTPGATYHFRVVVTNGTTTNNGADQSTVFTMPTATSSTVNTTSVNFSGHTSGVLNGNVTAMGVASNTYGYMELGETLAFGTTTSPQTLNAIGSFTGALPDGMVPGTTYYYRSVAQNGSVKVYGAPLTFTLASVSTTYVIMWNLVPILIMVGIVWFLLGKAYGEVNPNSLIISMVIGVAGYYLVQALLNAL